MVESSSNAVSLGQPHGSERPHTVCQAVVDAVASESDLPPTELDPLFDVVDVDALNSLFTSTSASRSGDVSFRYHGYLVSVSVVDGEINVTLDA